MANKRRPSAKSLANLKPIKKGEVRNPLGGRAVSPLIRAIDRFTLPVFTEVLLAVMKGNDKELLELTRPSQPGLLRLCAIAMRKAIKEGNYSLVERFADRLIGKVPEKIELDAHTKNQNITHTELEVKAIIQKLKADV